MNRVLSDVQIVADSMPVAFWASHGKDRGYQIAAWNDAAELLYGFSRTEAVGHSFLDLFVEPFLRQRAGEDCDRVISGEFAHPENVIAVDRDRRGEHLVLLTNVFRLMAGGEAYQAELSLDLTSSGLFEVIETSYRNTIREADARPEVRQLSNLLQSHLLREQENVTDWAANLMHEIRSEVASAQQHLKSHKRRAGKLSRDLFHLDYRLSALGFRADAFIGVYGARKAGLRGDFNGSAILESELSRLTDYGPILYRASVVSSIQTEGPILLEGRPESFRQCIYNLMQNACQHMRPSFGMERSVTVNSWVDDESMLCVEIANPGTMDHVVQVGDPSVDRISLGLKLVRRLVAEVGGSLDVYDDASLARAVGPSVTAKLRWPCAEGR